MTREIRHGTLPGLANRRPDETSGLILVVALLAILGVVVLLVT